MRHIHRLTLLLFLILSSYMSFAQVSKYRANGNIWAAKEFSKDIALFRAKSFLFREVLGSSETVSSFEIIPLAAASSGELTTLLYKSRSRNKEGMILGFFGETILESGMQIQGYLFRNLSKEDATIFLNKISSSISDNLKYLKEDSDNNNIYFTFQDIDVLIYTSSEGYSIRLFWQGFDSSWEKTAFERSKRRFEKKIN